MGWLKDLTLALPLGKPSLIIWASSRSCAPAKRRRRRSERNSTSALSTMPCSSSARSRCPLSRRGSTVSSPRRWQRPLPGYGVSSSRDSTICLLDRSARLGLTRHSNDGPIGAQVCSFRLTGDHEAAIGSHARRWSLYRDCPRRRRNSWCRAGRSLRPRLATSASCWLD